MPKKSKFRKMQKGRNRGKATRGNKVTDGEYGLQAVEAGLIKGNQIEAARIAMTRYTKRGGKVWIKIFPDKPITRNYKTKEKDAGKGKEKPPSQTSQQSEKVFSPLPDATHISLQENFFRFPIAILRFLAFSTVPFEDCSSPAKIFKKVDLPVPLAPTTP